MRQRISLKLFVTLAFLLLAVVLVIGYSLLSAHYYHKGMDSITASNMEEAARSYVNSVPAAKRQKLDRFRGYLVARSWDQMPLDLQTTFVVPPSEPGFSIKGKNSHWFKPPDVMYFVFRYQDGNETLFLCRRGSRATAPPLIGRNAADSRNMLLAISVSIAGVLAVTILLLLRRVSGPVTALGQWARSLDSNNLSQPPPDFSYPELNELAGLIRSSLSSVQESLDHEHSFLRHASHELRTPIAIIRNNVELLHKLENTREPERTLHQAKVIERIDRAGLNMQHLTETLLWLGRNEGEVLAGKQLQLDSVLLQLVEEMMYLLSKKEVELKIETTPCTVFLPEVPTRIVLANLIRNAFQHTWEGRITIHQQGNRVVISNPQAPADSEQQDLGFGLGLQLTSQLTKKLGWIYADESVPSTHRASIIFAGEQRAPL